MAGMTVSIGDTAPDFTLNDSNRTPWTLSSLRGKQAVLVVFYPFAFSGGCTTELCAVRDDLGSFQNDQVQIVGVSVDPVPTLKAWSAAQGYEFPLLSDFWPHGQVAREYGAFFEPGGMALRGTFLIDRAGVVRFAELKQPGELRDQAAWRRAVAALDAV